MLILSLDTTTKALSCALARDGVVVREEGGDRGREHASRLPGDLMTLLADTGVPLPEIDAFAVAVGPGSFTGLRIGIATMQGLAFATGKPLIGVSGFDALARVAFRLKPEAATENEPETTVATWVDAWRGEVYAALYALPPEGGGHVQIEPPVVAKPETLLRDLAARPTLFIGDAAMTFRAVIEERMGGDALFAEPAAPLLAGAIAELAAAARERPRPDAIRPLYVRRPDAELARDRRV